MNKLSKEERKRIIAALVEGNSMRAVARMADVSRNTRPSPSTTCITTFAEFHQTLRVTPAMESGG